MAEVLVTTQALPIMNLHPSEAYHGHAAAQPHPPSQRGPQASRTYSSHSVTVPYRGPVAPYAFQSTPNLRQTSSASSVPQQREHASGNNTLSAANNTLSVANRQNYAPSSTSTSTSSSSNPSTNSSHAAYTVAKDDSALAGNVLSARDRSSLFSSSTPDLSLISFNDTAKPSPDRYRRTIKRVDSNGGMAAGQPSNGSQRYSQQWPTPQAAQLLLAQPPTRPAFGHIRTESADDIGSARQAGSGRYRRRSVGGLEAADAAKTIVAAATAIPTWSQIAARGNPAQPTPLKPANTSRTTGLGPHERTSSAGSHSSAGSNSVRPSSSRQESHGSNKSALNARPTAAQTTVAPRPAEAAKRMISPSPLSQPVTAEAERRPGSVASGKPPPTPTSRPETATSQTPAQQQLTAISQADSSKGMKSRLRRALSFGSAHELRKASAQNNVSQQRRENPAGENELQGEDAVVAAQQEAAGIGAGIYSGQGVVYGSTDNLSISSTASSASIMLRKMGRGVKKSTKSLRGLFRPKSIVGDPVAEGTHAEPSVATAEVSRVTVEAALEKTSMNADADDQAGGSNVHSKQQRNSIDPATKVSSDHPRTSKHGQSDSSSSSRRSIVGGDRERQEILSAVKKGILKRNNTSSPVHSEPNPPAVPSLPGTPDVLHRGDEFFPTNRFGSNGSTRSLPDRPGVLRNVSWNPKVSFHDVWAGHEYDRRGDIATCNRLTPMLAQQIKEELNSFKMEMEVHEASKPHTHFF